MSAESRKKEIYLQLVRELHVKMLNLRKKPKRMSDVREIDVYKHTLVREIEGREVYGELDTKQQHQFKAVADSLDNIAKLKDGSLLGDYTRGLWS